jgi:hypothetical protein
LRLSGKPLITYYTPGGYYEGALGFNTNGDLSTRKKNLIMKYAPLKIRASSGSWIMEEFDGKPLEGGRWIFQDGCYVFPGRRAGGVRPLYYEETNKERRRQIMEYTRLISERLRNGRLPKPGTGGCAHCCVVLNLPEGRQTLGEYLNETEHLLMHVQHHQYLAELLARVAELTDEKTRAPLAKLLNSFWTPGKEADRPGAEEAVWSLLNREVRTYLFRHSGLAY